ncbi:LysR family transcriptional regulator [Candidimonas humi]|uniref:LysR family transcriptional regulator n=1 Tax=Candidimonas humi TaxID=683355 RepID=A0ABV8P2G1_9BURK|nr:LysR substrate-binding domain-containing protein [Candidimonas humi]MBV6306548.1 LysR family transcriptional regulator [Candidimonas humi]
MNRPETFLNRVTLRHLKLIHAIGQELSLSRAAARLHTSQPAVSLALREMESVLEARLFDRSTRKVRLTALGDVLCKHADRILGEIEQAALEFEAARDGYPGLLRVGLIPQVPASLLTEALESLQQDGHRIHALVREGSARGLAEELVRGNLDCLISHLALGPLAEDIESRPLYEDTTCLVVEAGHPLATRAELNWDDVRALRWIVPTYDAPVRTRIDREFFLRGRPDLATLIETDAVTVALGTLRGSRTVAVMNRAVAECYRLSGLIHILPLQFEVGVARFVLLSRREAGPEDAVALLGQALHRQIESWRNLRAQPAGARLRPERKNRTPLL